MKGTLLIFRPHEGTPEVQELGRLSPADMLNTLRAAIGGGWLEAVPHFTTVLHGGAWHNCRAFCDEEGKLEHKQLAFNAKANQQWRIAMHRTAGCDPDPDYLVGPIAVVFGDDEFMEAL